MSAYLTSPEDIAKLAAYAIKNDCTKYGQMYDMGIETMEQVATILAEQNITSIAARYPDMKGNEAVSFFAGDYSNEEYIADCGRGSSMRVAFDYKDIADAVGSYEYQSCEDDEYFNSTAFKIVTAIRTNLLNKLTRQ